MYENLKLRTCSNIIQNKRRGVLAVNNYNTPYQELICYDTDCFCGCITLFFNICKCGTLNNIINDNEPASLLITNTCGNRTETVLLEGTLEIIDDEVNCCCREENKCTKKVKFNINNVSGKRYCN